jgi:hypothetical protein
LERSDVDGRNRKSVCQTSPDREVLIRKMVVDQRNVFFADWKNRIVWKMMKNGDASSEEQVKNYFMFIFEELWSGYF